LVERPAPLVLNLCNEHGDEIASTTTPAGEAAIQSAVLLLARSAALLPGYRLTVTVEGGAPR
jgi:hypothetical protein